MDLNKLYFEHQLLQMQADAAPDCSQRKDYKRGAAEVAGRIGRKQDRLGAAAAAAWNAQSYSEPAVALMAENQDKCS